MSVLAPLRVLIAEDDAAINEEIKILVASLGYTVVGSAYNASQVVALASQLKPDVILLDIVMPDPDSGEEDKRAGFRATVAIMEQCPAPIVWLTAYETPQMIAEAGQLGVSAYLVKPPRPNETARAIFLAHARFTDMQELRRLNTALQTEITKRKQVEDALRLRMKEIESLQEQLREQALKDPLTGLYNRRYLNETMPREIARTRRENIPLGIIISDIDHFKKINDTYGHQVGDRFLVELANLLTVNARGSDIVCRYGGEEFLLVLPGVAKDSAIMRAEEIRQLCSDIIIPYEGRQLEVTLSIGIAIYPEHGLEAAEIILKADKALYVSKHRGRDCLTVWDEAIVDQPVDQQ